MDANARQASRRDNLVVVMRQSVWVYRLAYYVGEHKALVPVELACLPPHVDMSQVVSLRSGHYLSG